MAEPTLAIRDLRIAFPGREVVSGVNITVAPREIVAVIGESGSGKTLTALAVLGLLPRQAAVTQGVRNAQAAGRENPVQMRP